MYATSLHILQMLFNLSFTICFNIAAVCCHLKSVDFKVKLKAPLQGIHIMITISYKKALFFFFFKIEVKMEIAVTLELQIKAH